MVSIQQECFQKFRGQVSDTQNQNQIYFSLPPLLVFMLGFWHFTSDICSSYFTQHSI